MSTRRAWVRVLFTVEISEKADADNLTIDVNPHNIRAVDTGEVGYFGRVVDFATEESGFYDVDEPTEESPGEAALRARLAELSQKLKANGGRGVDLAEEIDAIQKQLGEPDAGE